MKPTNFVFGVPGKYFGMPVFKDANGILCLSDGRFVFRRDCVKKSNKK